LSSSSQKPAYTTTTTTSRVAPSALLPSALPSCAANVAAVADADGAAKWRADAAADGRAFVTLVSAADAAAECCLISDQLISSSSPSFLDMTMRTHPEFYD
jgi:hypothetical protein